MVELARAEAAMDEEDKHSSSLGHRTVAQTKGKRAAEGTPLANNATRDHRGKPFSCGRERLNGEEEEQVSALDHAKWSGKVFTGPPNQGSVRGITQQ